MPESEAGFAGTRWADTVLSLASKPSPYFAEAEGAWFGWKDGNFEIRRPAFKVVAASPLTKVGWLAIWGDLAANYPVLASAVSARLRFEEMSPSDRAQQLALEAAARARRPHKAGEPIAKYSVQCIGGYPGIAKGTLLTLEVWPDSFHLLEAGNPAEAASAVIPYGSVRSVDVVRKELGFARSVLGGLNSRQLNQQTTLHIAFRSADLDLVLRVEMQGVTLNGMANKAREFVDLLRTEGIVQQFNSAGERIPSKSEDERRDSGVAEEVERLAALHAQGALTDDEFEALKRRVIRSS